jgi:hypothetical protein
MRLSFIKLFLLLLFTQTVLLPVMADPEEDLMEFLTIRQKGPLLHEEKNKVQTLTQEIRNKYKQEASISTPRTTMTILAWEKLCEDPEAGFALLKQFADRGNPHLQYLQGFHLLCKKNSRAFDYLSNAAGQHHSRALEILQSHASQHDPLALFYLGRVHIDLGNRSIAADCVEKAFLTKKLNLNCNFTQGMILHLRGNFFGALRFYESMKDNKPHDATDFIVQLFKDCHEDLCKNIKDNNYSEEQIEIIRDYALGIKLSQNIRNTYEKKEFSGIDACREALAKKNVIVSAILSVPLNTTDSSTLKLKKTRAGTSNSNPSTIRAKSRTKHVHVKRLTYSTGAIDFESKDKDKKKSSDDSN